MKLLFSFALLQACASALAQLETNPQTCINPVDYDDGTDFFPQKFVPHETTDLFTISYHKTYKILTNKLINKSYLLYQCGTEPPEDEMNKHQLVLSVPFTGAVAITQTPQIPPLEMLAKRTAIDAYIGNPGLVSSQCLKSLMDEGTVEVIQYPEDPYNSTLLEQGTVDFLGRNPEAIVLTGPSGVIGEEDNERYVGVAASQERTAVATFDWLGYYSSLFNLEGMANGIVDDTENRYKCSAENAAALTSDVQPEDKPKLLWAQYFSSQNGWSVAECPTPDAAYYCEYAHHCAAEIISRPEGVGFSKTYGTPTVYWYLTDEEFLELGKDVDTWIYSGSTFESVYEEKRELLDQFKSVQRKTVYDTQGQGEFGWYEQRLAAHLLNFCNVNVFNNFCFSPTRDTDRWPDSRPNPRPTASTGSSRDGESDFEADETVTTAPTKASKETQGSQRSARKEKKAEKKAEKAKRKAERSGTSPSAKSEKTTTTVANVVVAE